jgi:hypothetical protein
MAPIIAFGAYSLFESSFKRYFISFSAAVIAFVIITASLVLTMGILLILKLISEVSEFLCFTWSFWKYQFNTVCCYSTNNLFHFSLSD